MKWSQGLYNHDWHHTDVSAWQSYDSYYTGPKTDPSAWGKIIKNWEETFRMQENSIHLGTEIDICLSFMGFLEVTWSRQSILPNLYVDVSSHKYFCIPACKWGLVYGQSTLALPYGSRAPRTQEGAGWGASHWFITVPALLILAVSGPANRLCEADLATAKLDFWFYTHLHPQPQERNNNKGSFGWCHHSELLWREQLLGSHKCLSPHCQPSQCRCEYLNFCRPLPLKSLPALEMPFDTCNLLTACVTPHTQALYPASRDAACTSTANKQKHNEPFSPPWSWRWDPFLITGYLEGFISSGCLNTQMTASIRDRQQRRKAI